MYGIVGVCDNDCSDVDLFLLDNSGRVIARDIDYDDTPAIFYRPSRAATFTVRISMVRCSVNPCRFGIALYSRP
jgi:hypothetical protein